MELIVYYIIYQFYNCYLDLDYGYQNLEYETWFLSDQWCSAKQSLAVIDTQIEQDLYDLPLRISDAAEAILDGVSDTNHNYGSIVGLLVLGRIIRIFGGTQGGMTDANFITYINYFYRRFREQISP